MKRIGLVQLIAFSGLILGSLVTNAEPFVWVANQTTKDITIIDAATNTVVDTIVVSDPFPRSLTFTPDGAFAYVAQSTGASTASPFNRVKVFNTATKALVTTITVQNAPEDIAITPDGKFAFVSILFSSSIFVIDTANNTFVSFPLGARGFGIAFTPDSAFAYIANGGSNTVSVVDTVTHTVVDTIVVGSTPKSVAITPDGAFAYVGNAVSNDVSVIDTATNNVVTTVPVGNRPETRGLAITPNGKFVYVGSSGGNSIFVIDTATNLVTTTIGGVNPSGGTGVLALAITPDGKFVYAANFASSSLTEGPVSVVSTATNTLVTTIDGGDRPQAVAITPSSATELSCSGFEPPMNGGAVKVKKNRALPHKGQLIDENSQPINDLDITAPPVIQVMFDSYEEDAMDVTGDAYPAGAGSDGNQFEFLGSGWQFNLKTKNYSAAGTYTTTMESGDETEYLIDETCSASFVIH